MNTLLDNYNEYEQKVVKDPTSDVLDLTNVRFMTPTLLLPSLQFAREYSLKIRVNKYTSDYVKRVLGIISGPYTTLPFRKLPKERADENNDLILEILGLLDKSYGGSRTLKHLLTEMINNVVDHSESDNAYTLAQKYPSAGSIDISFFDDGISIPKSFEDADLSFRDDCDAIYRAMNGMSSKEKIDDDPRGYGINTTTQLITRGNEGSILIASRRGLCHITKDGKEYKRLKRENLIDGTLVSIRVNRNEVQNFYKYMEYDRI